MSKFAGDGGGVGGALTPPGERGIVMWTVYRKVHGW